MGQAVLSDLVTHYADGGDWSRIHRESILLVDKQVASWSERESG